MNSVRLPLITLALATAALAGCQSAPTPTPSSVPDAGVDSSGASAAPEPGGSAPDQGGGAAGSGSGSGAGSGSGQAAGSRCTLDDLTARTGLTTGEAGERHTTVVWTNRSGRACTMTGFGGVDLRGPADDPHGPSYSLPRTSKAASPVRLAPGGTAHTTITWLPAQDGSHWAPTSVLVTPPDETRSATVSWPGGAVLRQDSATHPGTFIDPVQPGPGQ